MSTYLCFYCEGSLGECRKSGWECCMDCTHDVPGRNSAGNIFVIVPRDELHALEDRAGAS